MEFLGRRRCRVRDRQAFKRDVRTLEAACDDHDRNIWSAPAKEDQAIHELTHIGKVIHVHTKNHLRGTTLRSRTHRTLQ
jgi:hypothetical protein